jgi:hypothetical protein
VSRLQRSIEGRRRSVRKGAESGVDFEGDDYDCSIAVVRVLVVDDRVVPRVARAAVALRASVTHAPGGEPVRNLPKVARGDLVITEGGQVGTLTSGNFSMLFEQEGGDIGFGRTLNGRFSAISRDAGFDPYVETVDAGP